MNNKEDSEDALQDALLQGFRNIRGFRGSAKFSTWMNSILVNSVRSLYRKNRHRALTRSFDHFLFEDKEPWEMNALQDSHASPEDLVLEGERKQIVEFLFAELPAIYREAVWLREVEGFQITEVAARLGIGLAAAKARIHRGRHIIQRCARTRGVSDARPRSSAFRRLQARKNQEVCANVCAWR